MLYSSLSSLDNKDALKGLYGTDTKGQGLIGAFIQGYNFLVSAGSIPARLYLRDNIGERSFSPFAFLVCIGLHLWYSSLFIGIIALFTVGSESISLIVLAILLNPFIIYLGYIVKKGFAHFKSVIEKGKKNQTGYSYYRGDGKYYEHYRGKTFKGFIIEDTLMRMVVEPRAIIKTGLLTMFLPIIIFLISRFILKIEIDNLEHKSLFVSLAWIMSISISFTGLAIIFSGICLFLEELGIFLRIRGAALDMIDGEFDMQTVMNQKTLLAAGQTNNQTISNSSNNTLASVTPSVSTGYATLHDENDGNSQSFQTSPFSSANTIPQTDIQANVSNNESILTLHQRLKQQLLTDD